MILNLDKLDRVARAHLIYFATHDFILYKDRSFLMQVSCDEQLLKRTSLPKDSKSYECLEIGDAVILVLAGKEIMIVDKEGRATSKYDLNHQKIGRCVTRLFHAENNQIIFGTKYPNRIQFLKYDFVNQSRVCQTMSWEMSRVNHLTMHNHMLYALLDNAFIVCCDMSTGETLWTKFEAGFIHKNLIVYNDNLLYACQNILKIANGKEVENVSIPLARIHSLEHVIGDNLYFTSNEGKNICCYDLKGRRLKWEILGNLEIKESIIVPGRHEGRMYDMMVVRTKDSMGIVNLTVGKTVQFLKSPAISRIRVTGDHLLIHSHADHTEMIPGLTEEDLNVK